MKKRLSILLSVILIASLTACGQKEEDTTNTIAPTVLTAREQMLVGSQHVFMYDFETDKTYHSVSVTVEAYKNGKKISNTANLQCTIPSDSTDKKGNHHGSVAVMLGADSRFSAAVCKEDGSVISSFGSDVVEPIADLSKTESIEVTARRAIPAGGEITLAYLAYGPADQTQGTFAKSVFLDPTSHAEQSSVFTRIYLVKCKFS